MLTPADIGLPGDRFPRFRPGQDDTILSISASEARFNPLDAPVGAGKSIINIGVGTLGDLRTLYLVGTKSLQTQLMADFATIGMVDVRGGKNYPCSGYTRERRAATTNPNDSRSHTQQKAQESGHDCTADDPTDCHYRQAVNAARNSHLVVSNYAWWMAMARYSDPSIIGDFDLLILDEAHSCPDWLSDFCAVSLYDADLTDLNIPEPPTTGWVEWAEEAARVARSRYSQLLELERQEKNPARRADLTRDKLALERLGKDLAELSIVEDEAAWVREEERGLTRFTPISVATYAERYLYRGIEKVILCSATLTESTVRRLGITKDQSSWHHMDSGFDPRRCPFYYVSSLNTRVDHRISEGEMRMLMTAFDQVIQARRDRKGIIQVSSYQWAEKIVRLSKHSDIILSHGRHDSRTVVEKFRDSPPPRVLVSPVVSEGLDFPYGLCNYQIIVKIPFIDSRPPVIKARSTADRSFLNDAAAQSLMQRVGRSMRAADDISEVFLFDAHWLWFRNKARFPKWFRLTWRVVDSIPPALLIDNAGESSRRSQAG